MCATLAVAGALRGGAAAGAPAPPALTVSPARLVVPGPAPRFVWPQVGEAAVAVGGVGLLGASPDERIVPIASLTKMMTALVILADHPLHPGESGPTVTITPADVENYSAEVLAGDSTVRVSAGEVLSEYQLLEALLLPSADNIADRLALWDAGSIPAFVAKMNARAAALGLRATHYADASGVDPGSASDADEQALVASLLIADPVVRAIVRHRRVSFPLTGSIVNVNPALGVDGIVGLKSGYASRAYHCLVTAAFRRDHRVLVISVALGQPDPRQPARIDESLLEAATPLLELSRLVAAGAAVGNLVASGPSGSEPLFPEGPAPPAVVWPGLVLGERLASLAGAAAASGRPGSVVGVLTVWAPWGPLASVRVRLAPPLPAEPAAVAAAAGRLAAEALLPGGAQAAGGR